MGIKTTIEEFIEKSKKVHGNCYDYSNSEYVNNKTKLLIHCNICNNNFWQTPDNHINGKNGCPYCSGKKKHTTEEFAEKAKKIHGDKYDYSNSEYINNKTKLLIHCNICGNDFWQTPDNHINSKNGCPKCANNIKLTQYDFLERAKKIHGDKYDYSEAIYTGLENKILILCNCCGKKFLQTPHHHLSGEGCPNCNKSKGESKIQLFLENNCIDFVREKRYSSCKDKKPLPFDFYLPDYNLLIEYQGDQHFRSYDSFGGIQKLIKQQQHDIIKKEFCRLPNTPNLLEITYKDYNNISKILTEKLKIGNS